MTFSLPIHQIWKAALTSVMLLLLTGIPLEADETTKPLNPQTTCPIMGGKINRNLYVDVDGKRIYVCCRGCLEAVKKDPAAAIEKLKEKGERPLDAPRAKAKGKARGPQCCQGCGWKS